MNGASEWLTALIAISVFVCINVIGAVGLNGSTAVIALAVLVSVSVLGALYLESFTANIALTVAVFVNVSYTFSAECFIIAHLTEIFLALVSSRYDKLSVLVYLDRYDDLVVILVLLGISIADGLTLTVRHLERHLSFFADGNIHYSVLFAIR